MSDFDVDGARKAGYSDAEIADHLATTRSFDAAGARKAGYSDSDIVGHLSAGSTAAAAPAPRAPVRTQGASMMVNDRPMSMPATELPAPDQTAPPSPARPWSDVGLNALRNAPHSFYENYISPFAHPIDTVKSVGHLVGSLAAQQNATDPDMVMARNMAPGGEDQQKAAIDYAKSEGAPVNAIAKDYAKTYGSVEGFKNAFAENPFRIVGDASAVAGMPEAALARAPGMVGTASRAIGTAGRALDPVRQGANALGLVGQGAEAVTSNVLGLKTGAGPEAVRAAATAGLEGGEKGKAFVDNMRGSVPIDNIVDLARIALAKTRAERGAEYRAGMGEVGKDKTVLSFDSIDKSVDEAAKVGTYKGQVTEPAAVKTVDAMTKTVNDWKGLDPAEFHTPEGIDALKRTLANLRDATAFGTPERVAANRIYNAVRAEIVDQAPGYAKVMEKYGDASDKLNEVGKAFSLGERLTGDTASRKLTAAFRNNAQTNFGKRLELLGELGQHEPTLPYAVAGQSFNSLAPKGLVARLAALGTAPTGIGLLASSPRLVGEGAYYGGRATGMSANALARAGINGPRTGNAMRLGYQSGRMEENAQ